MLGRIKDGGRAWQGVSVCDANRELGKNVAYAIIAVDLLADGSEYGTAQLWELVKRSYLAATGEAPASSEQGQIRLVQALAKRDLLSAGKPTVMQS
jgi:hypothetical protein